MDLNKKKAEASALVTSFQERFKRLYGITPYVSYSFDIPLYDKLSIDDLYTIVNKTFIENSKNTHPMGIRQRGRDSGIVIYKHIFCKIACDMHFTTTFIGKYIGLHHATVIYIRNTINNRLETNDERVCALYNNIKAKLISFISEKNAYLDQLPKTNDPVDGSIF